MIVCDSRNSQNMSTEYELVKKFFIEVRKVKLAIQQQYFQFLLGNKDACKNFRKLLKYCAFKRIVMKNWRIPFNFGLFIGQIIRILNQKNWRRLAKIHHRRLNIWQQQNRSLLMTHFISHRSRLPSRPFLLYFCCYYVPPFF